MNKLGHFVKNFDDDPSEIKLQFNGVDSYKSKTVGCCSLLAYFIIVFIAIYKLIDLFQRNHVYVS